MSCKSRELQERRGGLAERKRWASPPQAAGLSRVPRRAAAASRPWRAAIPDAGWWRAPVGETRSPLCSNSRSEDRGTGQWRTVRRPISKLQFSACVEQEACEHIGRSRCRAFLAERHIPIAPQFAHRGSHRQVMLEKDDRRRSLLRRVEGLLANRQASACDRTGGIAS